MTLEKKKNPLFLPWIKPHCLLTLCHWAIPNFSTSCGWKLQRSYCSSSEKKTNTELIQKKLNLLLIQRTVCRQKKNVYLVDLAHGLQQQQRHSHHFLYGFGSIQRRLFDVIKQLLLSETYTVFISIHLQDGLSGTCISTCKPSGPSYAVLPWCQESVSIFSSTDIWPGPETVENSNACFTSKLSFSTTYTEDLVCVWVFSAHNRRSSTIWAFYSTNSSLQRLMDAFY